MARRLKHQKLDTLRHNKLGVSVDLCLDRNTALFTFELNGQIYSAKSMDELRSLAHREIEKLYHIKWEPVIEVTRLKPFARDDSGFLGFTQERFYIAQKADGAWIQRSWGSEGWPDDGRNHLSEAAYYADKNFAMYKDHDSRHDNTEYVIEYSDAAWTALEHISAQINVLRDRLGDLLMTRKGVAQLETMKLGKLLGDGTK